MLPRNLVSLMLHATGKLPILLQNTSHQTTKFI